MKGKYEHKDQVKNRFLKENRPLALMSSEGSQTKCQSHPIIDLPQPVRTLSFVSEKTTGLGLSVKK